MKEYSKIVDFLSQYGIVKRNKRTYCVFEKDYLPLISVEGNKTIIVYFNCFIDENHGKYSTHRLNKQREDFFNKCKEDARIDFIKRSAPVGRFDSEDDFISFLKNFCVVDLILQWYQFSEVQIDYELGKETLECGNILNYRVNIPTEVEIMRDVFRNNEYERKGLILKNDDVVLDLGGNIGSFSMRNFNRVKRIIAVEPEEVNCKIFHKNINENNADNVELIQKAVVGNNDKTRIFYLGKVPYYYSFYATSGRKGVAVECVNINDLIQTYNPSKLKIDIEGSEWEVICGCNDFKNVKQIIFEYNFDFNHDFTTDFNHFESLISHLEKHRFDVSELKKYKRTKNWAEVFLCNKLK